MWIVKHVKERVSVSIVINKHKISCEIRSLLAIWKPLIGSWFLHKYSIIILILYPYCKKLIAKSYCFACNTIAFSWKNSLMIRSSNSLLLHSLKTMLFTIWCILNIFYHHLIPNLFSNGIASFSFDNIDSRSDIFYIQV